MAGKRLDQLKLDTTPIKRLEPLELDPRDEAWYQFAKDIDDLLASGAYTWAEDTLTSIQETVRDRRAVTDGQRRAVRNIEGAKQRSDGGYRRRYEGYGR